ncbi:MAG: Gfo/Idh/MocA family oxidoreductase [Planctomycetota bacterium]|jgi:predicted dehydrogenase|nr:Gfo/Idh/MocA family oxidoreductase [Planctomycetota bacterium]
MTATAAGIGAMAGAYVMRSRVKKRPPPSERITMGIIGLGEMGDMHLGLFFGFSEVQILAVCDVDQSYRLRDKGRLDRLYSLQAGRRGSYKGTRAYRDYRELLARDDIDAVLIATPEHWHGIMGMDAARSGKDIYGEKPLCQTVHESRELVKAVRRYDTVFQTGSHQRSNGTFRFACEMVRSGRIGRVHTVHVGCGGPPEDCYLPEEPVPAGLDWDMWVGPAPYRPYNSKLHPKSWRPFRDFSGGGMTDWGAHMFDIAQWGLGMDHTGPTEILPPVKGLRHVLFRYANGTEMIHDPDATGVRFVGVDGEIEVNRGYLKTTPDHLTKESTQPGEVFLTRSENHRANWLECIRTRRRPICDVEIGCRSVTVCHLGNIAYWLNRPLKWNPETERFINDEAANRLLDRPRRAPWDRNT